MKKSTSLYQGERIAFATMHRKEFYLQGACKKILGASLQGLGGLLNTDLLGTFSGEIERPGSQKETVLKKCLLGLEQSGQEYGIASEGSFGPDSLIPFFNSSVETIVFIDKKRNFQLLESARFLKTNYAYQIISTSQDYSEFLKGALFPSHGLIVRPNVWEDKTIVFKGIQTFDVLKKSISICCTQSADGNAFIQTDMRAHMNPTRAFNLLKLGIRLFRKLGRLCPSCHSPGWGPSRKVTGRPCRVCLYPTLEPRSSLWSCSCCSFVEEKPLHDSNLKGDPRYCPCCNP